MFFTGFAILATVATAHGFTSFPNGPEAENIGEVDTLGAFRTLRNAIVTPTHNFTNISHQWHLLEENPRHGRTSPCTTTRPTSARTRIQWPSIITALTRSTRLQMSKKEICATNVTDGRRLSARTCPTTSGTGALATRSLFATTLTNS